MNPEPASSASGSRIFGLVCYYFLLFGFFLGIWLFNLFCLLARPFHSSERDAARIRVYIQRWLRAYLALLKATGRFEVRYENCEPLSRIRGEVIVANHPSVLDAPLLLCLSPNLICLYKTSLHGRLLSSHTARMAGYLSNDEGLLSIRKAVRQLRMGTNIVVFPEGTRTETWPLNPLHKGYALIAREANAPVRLLTIEHRTDLLSKAHAFLHPPRLPARFTLRLGPGIDPAAFPHVNALNRHVEHTLAETLRNTYRNDFAFPMEFLAGDAVSSRYAVTIPESPAFCRDHFPGNPVLPAYAVLIFCRYAVIQTRSLRTASWRWEQVKFVRPILPGGRLVLKTKAAPGDVKLTLEENGKRCFSGRFRHDP